MGIAVASSTSWNCTKYLHADPHPSGSIPLGLRRVVTVMPFYVGKSANAK
jgi:hypothetical protein